MFQPVKIAPSILSANFLNMGEDIRMIEDAGAGYIHYDVIDGHFAPNLTVGIPLLKQLAKVARIPLDVHLMISNPMVQLPWYVKAGADMITVHIEALEENEVDEMIDYLHENGVKASLSVKPNTPVSAIAPYIAKLDMVLIMSVEPGFSGQSYIESSDKKVAEVVELARAAGVAPLIQVDGGMGVNTAPLVAAAGADVIVCGNAVFGAEDPAVALAAVEAAANAAREA